MVLGILIAAITAPGLLGSQEAIRQGQSKDKREEHRARRCNLIASCLKTSSRSREINGRSVVLRNGKLWIETTSEGGEPFGHMYAGYYLPYPDTKYEGLVTTITDVAPIMNWVYIDKETYEVKYGVRADAQPNLTGPFDCTRQDRRLTFDGWEGWCAVEEYEGYWSLYFDVDDNGLKQKIEPGIRVLELELSRKEKKFKKDMEARRQDQTTKRAVDTDKNAPVDQPLQPNPKTQHPGVFSQTPPHSEVVSEKEGMPKTAPPAYSIVNSPVVIPTPERSKKGAVHALDDLLALEAQGATPVRSVAPRERTKSTSTAPRGTTTLSENRIIPKLNRNSGSKAIAQAQMFEALAAAQHDDKATRSTSNNKRVSSTSSLADSESVYSEEDQRLSRDIRPQSSMSQRALYRQPVAPPSRELPIKPPQLSRSLSLHKDEEPIDPAVFAASGPTTSKRTSQVSSSSQRKRKSKMFVAQRPGKRVSPRTSARKSLTDTVSSAASRQGVSIKNRPPRVQMERNEAVNRTQGDRKTTSTFLRDLDDLVSQEVLPRVPTTRQRSPASETTLAMMSEQRGDNRRMNKQYATRE
ncbi:hypothetical protein SVAN01_11590 [Stagonosporopsis vannaccii]|nr:hypothetical protein SVAN01_11590 [Stagonosporopsis vannaccii]